MNPNYFSLFQLGVPGELSLLNTPQKLTQLAIAQDMFLFEGDIAIAYLNAFIEKNAYTDSPKANAAFINCIEQTHQSMPLHYNIAKLFNTAFDTLEEVLPTLQALSLSSEEETQFRSMDPNVQSAKLRALLKKNSSHVGAADALLTLSAKENLPVDEWIHQVTCPNRLKPLWEQRLFLYYARLGKSTQALNIWEHLPPEAKNALNTVYAADNYALAGNISNAIAHYSMALKKNPNMGPVHRRLQELLSPQQVNTHLIDDRRTSICLYSWNKGEMLEQTLRSLAATQLGNCTVFVLLNGCTDDSKERMTQVQPLFGDRFHLVELPINIGAPAARNWLINMPEVQQSDFIAFLDDDVLLQKDWLPRMVSDLELDKQIGVTGCRIVDPVPDNGLPLLQYIYRLVDFAQDGIFKLSPATPLFGSRDTGLYTFRRECQNVMGCQHVFRTSLLKEIGDFDIRFSPSQVDDIDHDLSACLKGYKVWYCGTVQCQHLQGSGVSASKKNQGLTYASLGSILGNDLKLCYKHYETMHQLFKQAINIATSKNNEP